MAVVKEAQAKGTGLISGSKWLRDNHGEEAHRRVLASMSSEVRDAYESLLATEWYPVQCLDEFGAGVAREVYGDEPIQVEQAMIDQGRYIAEDNLSTVFRVLLIFVGDPEQMFHSLPKFWNQYFEGVEVEVDDAEIAQKRGICRVRGLGEVRYVAPVAVGWMRFGLRKVGAKEIQVEEENYKAGTPAADPLVFRLSWS